MGFEEEQGKMVNFVRSLTPKTVHSKGEWNKFLGDSTNRLLIRHLKNHLPKDYKAIGPSAYISGVPREFDLIIVKKGASAIGLGNAYPRDSTLAVVEVKRTGFFYKKEEAESRIRNAHKKLVFHLKGIPLLYITFHESAKLMDATKQVYGDLAFFLSTGTNYSKILNGEWKRFIEVALAKVGKASK